MWSLKSLNNSVERRFIITNWNKKRFVWRYSCYFTSFFILLFCGLLYTVLLRYLLSHTYFNNHSCSNSTIKRAQGNFMAMIIFTIIIGSLNFIFSRLTYLYSNYTNSEFYNLGIYCRIVGFLIKYISWILSVIYLCWLTFLLVNIISMLAFPKEWCSTKYNVLGLDAKDNCILIKNDAAGCEITDTMIKLKKEDSCNDFNILKMHNFLLFVRNSYDVQCSLKEKVVCELYLQYTTNKPLANWNKHPNCIGENILLEEQIFTEDSKQKSDFYLISIAYLAYWCFTALVIFSFFIILKISTPIDPSFMLNSEHLNIFFKFTRLLDTWR